MNRAVFLAVGLSLAIGSASAEAEPGKPWLDGEPRTESERSLVSALERVAPGAATSSLQSLEATATALAGTREGGLLRLELGWRLLDDGQPALALAPLQHPDVARTGLASHAALALGRALEALGRPAEAGLAYLQAASTGAATRCPALVRAFESLAAGDAVPQAIEALARIPEACPPQKLYAWSRQAELLEHRSPAEAAALYDRVDAEAPASPEASVARARLEMLGRGAPRVAAEERFERSLARAEALTRQGKARPAELAWAKIVKAAKDAALRDRARVQRARLLQSLKRRREATVLLKAVGADSPSCAEAAWLLARDQSDSARVAAFESVVSRFPGSEWAEESLLSLANHYTKDAREDEALPWWTRLLETFPDGRYAERAAWKVGFGAYLGGRHEQAASVLEKSGRKLADSRSAAGPLYWAGRSREALGDRAAAARLYAEVVQRFAHTYHGQKALTALGPNPKLLAAPGLKPAVGPADLNEPRRARVRELLLLSRLEPARDELQGATGTEALSTLAWIDSRRGRLREALVAMKRAFPGWVSSGADAIPKDAFRVMFPLAYEASLRAEASEQGLDPALVAALICQESTFDPRAVSKAGARGLMQVMPATGRILARAAGVRYRTAILHDPDRALDFGTRYFKELLDRFGGRPERALAAYNAGPHRVDQWTLGREDVSQELFVESIPFSETRQYVTLILASAEQYRRIYGLQAAAGAVSASAAPR